ncbi:hypothetical protein PILCRDRAFT_824315, partial [Piloderma croceum F 1598]
MSIAATSGNNSNTASSREAIPTYLKLLPKDIDDITRHLERAAMELRADGPYYPDMLFIGSRIFLPRKMINRITDNFYQIDSEETLKACMEGWRYWDDYGVAC